jgi:O-antigen/teichoic acid export membrane protein
LSIKKLAGQTLWYGLSSILGRFINYLLTPLLTALGSAQFGEYTTVYANITFFNIIFTYGMETAYFRFSRDENEKSVFNTASTSLILTTIPLAASMLFLQKQLSEFWSVSKHPEYVIYFAVIVAFDSLSQIPFAKLRFEQRPQKFAMIKLLGILVTVSLTVFFINICPWLIKNGYGNLIASWYKPNYGIGYAFIANMISSVVTLLFLFKEFTGFSFKIDFKLWRRMMAYALPLLIVGFGGMINETIDRTMLPKLLVGTEEFRNSMNGIYGANYKLAILIVLFIQTFRMGAEPFFIKQSTGQDAPKMYARIMNLFVVACCVCYLVVVCYLDIWKYFMRADLHPEYLSGLVVVPILLLGKIFLGIYYNLSIWYKVSNKTMIGAYITLGGAAITLIINLLFIKQYGFITCAWASLACYGFMMVVSYFAGQKYYPVPYDIKKILFYIAATVITYFITKSITASMETAIPRLIVGTISILAYLVLVLILEKEEFKNIPIIKKIYRK